MYGPAGHAYVYFVYGMHRMLNVVSEPDGRPGAVLIRALAPALGAERMRARRGRRGEPLARVASGPARLCQALGIGLELDGVDLAIPGELWIAAPGAPILAEALAGGVTVGPRVGVDYAGDGWAERPWRFGLTRHAALSRPFPGQAGVRG